MKMQMLVDVLLRGFSVLYNGADGDTEEAELMCNFHN